MKNNWKAWIVVLLAAIIFLPFVAKYLHVIQQKDYYILWPVYFSLAGFIFIRRWRLAAPSENSTQHWMVPLLFIVAIPPILFSLLFYVLWVMTCVWIFLMGAGALHLSRYRKIDNVFGIWLLLFLVLRPPYQMTLRLMVWMENLSVTSASAIMDYRSVVHVVQGNILSLPEHDFKIDAICSGSISLMSTIATAAFICVIRNRRVLHCVILLALAVVSTWMLNILRFLLVTQVSIKYDIDLLSGGYLTLYQVGSFFAALLMMLSFDSLVLFCISRRLGEGDESSRVKQKRGWLLSLWEKADNFRLADVFPRPVFKGAKLQLVKTWAYYALVVVLLMLVCLEAVVVYYRPMRDQRELMYGESDLTKIKKESVLIERPGWEVVDYHEEKRNYSSIWGALSSTWRLKYNGITVVMSLDYPFDDWHDVKSCYSKIGWKMENEQIIDELPVFEWKISQTDMVLPNGEFGYILCSLCDHAGNAVEPKPVNHDWTMFAYRFNPSRMTPPFGDHDERGKNTYYQTQCMVATTLPLDELTRNEILMMYAEFRGQIRQALVLKNKANQNNQAND